MKNRKAFTLLETMLVFAILFILLIVATPKYVNMVRNTAQVQCQVNRLIMEQAEARYRLEHNNSASSSVMQLRDSGYIDRVPKCNAGGSYVWKSTGTILVMGCSLHYWPF